MIETRTHLDLRLWLQRHREQRIAIPVVDLVLATLKYTRCLHVVSIAVSEWRLGDGRSLVMLRSGHAGLHIGNWMTGIEWEWLVCACGMGRVMREGSGRMKDRGYCTLICVFWKGIMVEAQDAVKGAVRRDLIIERLR